MATIPFGLSISHLVSSAGADVGFAAILGLAILVLLFFSQARETATLRRRADEAEEQLRDLAAYVDQLQRRPAAPPTQAPATGAVAPPPAAARVAARQAAFPGASRTVPAGATAAAAPAAAAAAGAVATIPAAPAGVGAPALSSATRLIPLTGPGGTDPISIRALKNGDREAAPAPAAAEAQPGATATATATPVPVGPPPSTAAGGANGSTRVGAAVPAAAPAAAAAAAPGGPPAPGGPAPQRREPASAGRPAGPPTFNDPVPPSRTRVSRLALIVASVVAVIVVIVAVLVLVNRGSGNGSAQNSAVASRTSTRTGSRAHHRAAAVRVTPSTVTVAVLNGTTTSHLAADVMSKLTSAGYKPGATTNAPEQNLTSTIVGYTETGFRPDALAVAKSLNVGASSVRAVTAADRTAACHGATTGCTADVVVTLGSDLSSAASTGSTATTP